MSEGTTKLTVVCSHPDWSQPLLYCVEVPEYLTISEANGEDILGIKNLYQTISELIAEQRKADFCEDDDRLAEDMNLLFAFPGDLTPQFDWRD